MIFKTESVRTDELMEAIDKINVQIGNLNNIIQKLYDLIFELAEMDGEVVREIDNGAGLVRRNNYPPYGYDHVKE